MSVTTEPAVWVSGQILESSTDCALCGPSHDEIEVSTRDFVTFEAHVATGCYGGSRATGTAPEVLRETLTNFGDIAGVPEGLTALRAVMEPTAATSSAPWRAGVTWQGEGPEDFGYLDVTTTDRRAFHVHAQVYSGPGLAVQEWDAIGDAEAVLARAREAFPDVEAVGELADALAVAALA